MFKVNFFVDQQITELKYLQQNNCIIVNIQKMCPSPLQDAQQRLLLDFRIRDTPDEETKFSAVEHLLRELFNNIIPVQNFPGCLLRINIFILMNQQNLKATVLNGCWLALLRHGIPMKKSVWAYEWKQSERANLILLNMNYPSEIIYGDINEKKLPQKLTQKMESYKEYVFLKMNQSLQ